MCCNWLQLLEPTHSSDNFSSFIPPYYYDVKLHKNLDFLQEISLHFLVKTVKNGQYRPISVTAHQFFVPLSRVRKRKSSSWKSGVNTLKTSTQHLSISGYSDYSENSDCSKDSDWLLRERDWNIEQTAGCGTIMSKFSKRKRERRAGDSCWKWHFGGSVW